MNNIISLGSYDQDNTQYKYYYNNDIERFIIKRSQFENQEEIFKSIVRVELDTKGMILEVLKNNPSSNLTCDDINIYEHQPFLYGNLVLDLEDHYSDYRKEVYSQLKVYQYNLVPLVRIVRIEEVFPTFRARKYTISNEFHEADNLDLDKTLEQQVLRALKPIDNQ